MEGLLAFMFEQNLPVLIKGTPGIGKSDIVAQVAKKVGMPLIISHPVVADPTDYKGLPFAVRTGNGISEAQFLPFGDLKRLLETEEPVIYFLDDLGQATPAVQSAVMQLILARQVNGHKISPEVRFVAATNGRADRANVQGILEPVKSRFASIIQLDVKTDDWVDWAYKHKMPFELISFIQFKPSMLNDFQASRDIVNSPCPRTVAFIGKMLNAGLPDNVRFEAISGAAGESFAIEFTGFVKCYINLPTIDEIISGPMRARLPDSISARYAITGAIVDAMEEKNITPIMKYLERLGNEMTVMALKNASMKNPNITSNSTFINWAMKHSDLFLS